MRKSRKKLNYSSLLVTFFAAGLLLIFAGRLSAPETKSSPTPPVTSPVTAGEAMIEKIPYNDEAALKPILEKFGVKRVMEQLVKESAGGSAFDCHQQAHHIGRVGYQIEKAAVFQNCDASCHSGCYHGAMENFLHDKGTADLTANIDEICRSFETGFGVFECLHGVGHGVLAYLVDDLPGPLKECGSLKDSFSRTSCYGGAFMENILTGQGLGASLKNHDTPWINRNDPYFPCNKIDQGTDVQYQCYQMQTSWMLTLANYNFDTVAMQCLGAPENMISVCFKSFGRDAAGHTLRKPPEIIKLCDKVPKQNGYPDRCVEGAVNVIIDFWGPGLKNQATELCELAQEPTKSTCYRTLFGRLKDLFTDKYDQYAICKSFEDEYQYLCAGIIPSQ